MNPACIMAIGQVLGRQPSEADLRNVEDRITRAMRGQATADPQAWLGLPRDEQVRQGAMRAAQDLNGEQALAQKRKVQQVLAAAKIGQQLAAFPGTPLEALQHLIVFRADRKGSVMSVETQAKAVERLALRQLLDTLESTSPRFFGLVEDQAGVRDLVRELHGERTGNADAASGAKAFKGVAEQLRVRFNAAGGDIGKLDDWGMPHHHSQSRVAKAGADAWVREVMPKLDRSKYVRDDGARMDDTEVDAFLREAWISIATGGANKHQAGTPQGSGARANRGNKSRQVHFKAADDYLDYQSNFGDSTPYEVIVNHIGGVAKDIAMIEAFGPNPDNAFRAVLDRALTSEKIAKPTELGKLENQAKGIETRYNMVAGITEPVGHAGMAAFFDGLRNIMVASKLGSAVISALSDEGTMRVAAHVNQLPEIRLIANELAALNPTNQVERRMALRAGLAMNTLAHSLNRFGNGALGSGWTSKVAQFTIRASGLNAMTDARRRAWGVTMMHATGAVVRDAPNLAALDAYDARVLLSKGVTPENYEVWRRATLEDWGGGNDTMLTPDAIYRIPDAKLQDLGDPATLRDAAATRLLGAVLEETDVAVIEPGVHERAMMQEGARRGTLKGELTRSLFLFKSFPLSMMTRHWSRAMAEPSVKGRVGYGAALLATTTVIGMVALQAAQVVQGKDPRDMTDARSWVQALLKGGALSLYGDFLLNDSTEFGGSALSALAGPVAGTTEQALALTLGNLHQSARGEETHVGAEAVKFVRSNTPGANLWYARAAVDHLVFHQLQEYLSPGYLKKMKRRSEKEYGQEFWWEPGEPMPERAPDMARALGE